MTEAERRELRAAIDRRKRERDAIDPAAVEREQIAEKQRAYREANKAEIAEKQRAYYEANKAEIAEKKRAYHEANKAEIAEKKRAYHEANKAKWAPGGIYYERQRARAA